MAHAPCSLNNSFLDILSLTQINTGTVPESGPGLKQLRIAAMVHVFFKVREVTVLQWRRSGIPPRERSDVSAKYQRKGGIRIERKAAFNIYIYIYIYGATSVQPS